MTIKFGSDGFRGVIGESFTREAVARIALAAAEHVAAAGGAVVPIGYDTRFLSERFALVAAAVVQQAGLKPLLSAGPSPSPYISFAAHHLQAPLALQLTASHNPNYYGGVKLKASYGGSLDGAQVRAIEARANALDAGRLPSAGSSDAERFDLTAEYQARMRQLAGPQGGMRLVVDHMHGATAPLYLNVLSGLHDVSAVLRSNVDPLFGGGKPEPLEPLLEDLKGGVVAAEQGTVGLAFDGDGDRLAVIDETGQYLQSHEIFALLLEHLVRSGQTGGRVVTTVSFSSLLARIAQGCGLRVTEVPVGFKHVAAEMLRGDVLIGGEESGGAAFGHYLPERDALLMALTLLRAKAQAKSTLRVMLDEIYTRHGRPHYARLDVQLTQEQHAAVRGRMGGLVGLGRLAGDTVEGVSGLDGVKLRTAVGWVLVRASGTEPLARFYAETDSEAKSQAYIEAVRNAL